MRILAIVIAAAGVMLAADYSEAQIRGAGSKITGAAYEYPYFYDTAQLYQEHAYEHANLLRNMASYNEPVPQAVAQEHTTAIRQSVESANKKYAGLRKMAGDHKMVNKHLDAIDSHHKQVMKHLDAVDAHLVKGDGDPGVISKAMHGVASSLKAAQAEHEKVMQYFSGPQTKK